MQSELLPLIREASVFDVKKMTEAQRAELGFLVLVMRIWPRGFSWENLGLDLWILDAAPSRGLLKAYQGGGINWEEFARRYAVEQVSDWKHAGYYKVGKGKAGRRPSTISPLQQLSELRSQHGLVTVLCHERVGNCHRYVLVRLVNGEISRADRQNSCQPQSNPY